MTRPTLTETTAIYLTVNQFCNNHPAFKLGGMRALIFNENSNGLSSSGAIVRMGRKVLIHQERFFNWLDKSSKGGANN